MKSTRWNIFKCCLQLPSKEFSVLEKRGHQSLVSSLSSCQSVSWVGCLEAILWVGTMLELLDGSHVFNTPKIKIILLLCNSTWNLAQLYLHYEGVGLNYICFSYFQQTYACTMVTLKLNTNIPRVYHPSRVSVLFCWQLALGWSLPKLSDEKWTIYESEPTPIKVNGSFTWFH